MGAEAIVARDHRFCVLVWTRAGPSFTLVIKKGRVSIGFQKSVTSLFAESIAAEAQIQSSFCEFLEQFVFPLHFPDPRSSSSAPDWDRSEEREDHMRPHSRGNAQKSGTRFKDIRHVCCALQ